MGFHHGQLVVAPPPDGDNFGTVLRARNRLPSSVPRY